MKGMTLAAIAEACNGIYHGEEIYKDTEVTAITTDSRQVQPQGMFIAIKGARSDGHDFIKSCYDNGVLCCITEKELPGEDNPYIQVESSLQALKDIAALYRTNLDIKVVGITGSVGKTSTKETIASVLSQKYKVLKTQGNFNNEIGLPLTVFRLTQQDEVAVLEMGISDFGEMTRLTAIAKPDICVITNIGQCHLENLKSRDGILKAKTEIFTSMNRQGTVILNGDDDKLITVKEVYGKAPVFFGVDNRQGIYADNIESLGLGGISCRIHNIDTSDGVREISVNIPVAGQHMVYNAMAAAAVGAKLGLTSEQIKNGIESLQTIAGRNHIIKENGFLIIDDCYNANPVSMKASIDVIGTAKGRKVCILGDMFELGAEEEKLHYEVGEYLAKSGADVLLTAGKLSKALAQGAVDYASQHDDAYPCRIQTFDTRDDLIAALPDILEKGDNILVKASHGMEFQAVIEAIASLNA
ncbi:MAG: UDP-N-acetylmuramoyl-tripeptide--D-alanyl-D-alanine ligase [Lachnospira sp.]|nr:UDP-N-acetylmuramoyl-tripeptide--D-alanyl-D-alanine ligase [Lachnospira sp.]